MENTEFRKLNKNDEKAYFNFIGEFVNAHEKFIPSSIDPKDGTFSEWLSSKEKIAQGIDLAADKVPASTYFLINKNTGKILGAVNIRHKLNDYLLAKGGNIGYGVAPSERRKGYATLMLKTALEECRDLGMKKALVTCNKNNIGSAKTIGYNNGVFENEITEEDGNIICRYWIDIEENK